MKPITLANKFKNALLNDFPEFEIIDLRINEKDKVVTIEAKAKENHSFPIGQVLHLNFEKQHITSWLKFNDFQFYRDRLINVDTGESEGDNVPCVENIIGTKGNGLSGSM